MMNEVDFETLYQEHHTIVLRTAAKYVGHDRAEDVAQEVWTKVYFRYEQFNEGAKFSTWVCAITRNASFDVLRQQKSRAKQATMLDLDGSDYWLEVLEDPTKDSEASLRGLERISLVKQALAHIPPKYRVPFLAKVGGLRIREIAEILGIPEGTVKSRICRIRAELNLRCSN